MTILDAYAVIAFLRNEAAADDVRSLLADGGTRMTAVGVAEVMDHLVRIVGVHEDTVALDLGQLGLLDAVAVDPALGLRAGTLRARHYHRTERAVSMADCVAAEAARHAGEPLVTSDPHLLDVCALEGIPYLVLPGSDGSRWSAGW